MNLPIRSSTRKDWLRIVRLARFLATTVMPLELRGSWWVLCALLVLLSLGECVPGLAADCERPATLGDMNECSNLRLRSAQREMAAELKLIETLEDEGLRAAIGTAQEAWSKWCEAEGEVAAAAANDKLLAKVNQNTIRAQLTEDRVRDLRTHTGQ